MKTWAAKSFTRVFVFLFVLGLTVPGAWAIINVNQDTFVLSDEAPGHLIATLVTAGYGEMNLYQTLVQIVNDTNPSVSGILTPAFLSTLRNAPASSEIFTTHLKDVSSQGISVSISTDGTARYDNIEASTYSGTHPTLQTNISGVGNAIFVYSTDPQAPLNANLVQGPLAGMTTTYNAFAVAASFTTASVSVPTLNQWGMMVFSMLMGFSAVCYLRRQKRAGN